MMRKQMRAMVLSAFVLATATACTPFFMARTGDHRGIAEMIANAKTPGDHEAIAAHFDAEARKARDASASHAALAETYRKQGGVPVAKWNADGHCKGLAAAYEAAAKEYEALAAGHRQMVSAGK